MGRSDWHRVAAGLAAAAAGAAASGGVVLPEPGGLAGAFEAEPAAAEMSLADLIVELPTGADAPAVAEAAGAGGGEDALLAELVDRFEVRDDRVTRISLVPGAGGLF